MIGRPQVAQFNNQKNLPQYVTCNEEIMYLEQLRISPWFKKRKSPRGKLKETKAARKCIMLPCWTNKWRVIIYQTILSKLPIVACFFIFTWDIINGTIVGLTFPGGNISYFSLAHVALQFLTFGLLVSYSLTIIKYFEIKIKIYTV